MNPAASEFPADFLWGAATAAYQIEGAVHADGRGESIWDRFCRKPGAVERGESGQPACDHYNRWPEDVALMAELGLRAYRFSVAWPRIQPDGRGAPLQAGVDFYSRLADALLERGIAPCVTLYHWDLPQALEDAGGWPARDTAARFADYAVILFRTLGDRVARWITHNEPWCAAFLGYFRGVHAPGRRDLGDGLAAAHHLLLSHGMAVQACRAELPAAKIGITLSLFPTYPYGGDPRHQAAADLSDAYTNRWFLDPIYRGAYPAEGRAHLERLAGPIAAVREGDLATIAAPTDFLGVNYYHRRVIEETPGQDLGWRVHDRTPGVPTTDLGWEIVPGCFTDMLLRLTRDYGRPALLVTENGAVFDDVVAPDGAVHDESRVEFLRAHFRAALDAMEQGARLEGYTVWSLLDNFEWAFGYSKRFGIVRVDYETQRRTPKGSARFLARVIRHGLAGA